MADAVRKDLGPVSGYAIAVAHGYEGTEAEWIQLVLDTTDNAEAAAESAEAAAASAADAAESAASLVLDTTLTQAGKAAEAKATGDGIRNINSVLHDSNLNTVESLPFTWVTGSINNSGADRSTAGHIRTDYVTIPASSINLSFSLGTYTYLLFKVVLYNASGVFQSYTYYHSGNTAITGLTVGWKIRIDIGPGVGSSDVVSASDGDTLVSTSYLFVQNVQPDTTLALAGRAAEAKATGDAIAEMFQQKCYLAFEQGYISDTGTNAGSISTTRIRTSERYVPGGTVVKIHAPAGVVVNIAKYSAPYGALNDAFISPLLTNLTDGAEITVAAGVCIRLDAKYSSGADMPPSVGSSIYLSWPVSGQALLDRIDTERLNDYSSLSIFMTLGVIGDSWSSGSIHIGDGSYVDTYYDMSWPQIVARKNGITATNFSTGGLSTKTWLANTSVGLSALLADTPKNLYVICLGINDNTQIAAGTLALGTIDDVKTDYTQNPDTFYGDYARIIGNIKAHAPKAVIICLSVPRPTERNMDAHIKAIAEKCGVPYVALTDDAYFTSGYFYGSIYGGHMSAYGYSGLANGIQRLIQRYIITHRSEFSDYDGQT